MSKTGGVGRVGYLSFETLVEARLHVARVALAGVRFGRRRVAVELRRLVAGAGRVAAAQPLEDRRLRRRARRRRAAARVAAAQT